MLGQQFQQRSNERMKTRPWDQMLWPRAQANEQTAFTFIVHVSLPDSTQGQTAKRQLQ